MAPMLGLCPGCAGSKPTPRQCFVRTSSGLSSTPTSSGLIGPALAWRKRPRCAGLSRRPVGTPLSPETTDTSLTTRPIRVRIHVLSDQLECDVDGAGPWTNTGIAIPWTKSNSGKSSSGAVRYRKDILQMVKGKVSGSLQVVSASQVNVGSRYIKSSHGCFDNDLDVIRPNLKKHLRQQSAARHSSTWILARG